MELLASGEANPRPDITVESTFPAVATVSADRAPGPVALSTAAEEAVERARAQGVAAVGPSVLGRGPAPGAGRLRRPCAEGGPVHRVPGRGPLTDAGHAGCGGRRACRPPPVT
ncbi:hypothetical protein GTY58_07160 [Streptomyces sp. SID5469]|nr:hypothetical protein [Streptomyces sp. SID5469]